MSDFLAGRRFLVTRRAQQSSGLASLLHEAGALVSEAPAIAIEPPLDPRPLWGALARLDQFDWIAFTSANAVAAAAAGAAPGARWPSIAAVGPASGAAVELALGRPADLIPTAEFRAEGLARALVERGVSHAHILLPVSDKANTTLETELRAAGARVERVIAYRTVLPEGASEALAAALARGFDMALFASPSAVENVAALLGERTPGLLAGVIGPVTRDAAIAAGFEVRVIAEPSTAKGLVAGLVRFYETVGAGG